MRTVRIAVIAAMLLGCAVVAVAPLTGQAQSAAAPAPKPDDQAAKPAPILVLKLYDVSDLTSGVLPFKLKSDVLPPSVLHFADDVEGWNGLFCGRKRQDADVEPLGAIDLNTLWDFVAGQLLLAEDEVAMRDIGGMLAVNAEAAVHDKIAGILQQIRVARPLGKSVDIVAHWVLLEPDKVSSLYKAGTRDIDPQKLTAPGSLYGRSAARTITGQAVTLMSGRARTVITDQNPSVGQAAAAYDPDVAQILSGLLATVDVRVMDRFAVASVAAAGADWDEPAKSSKLRSLRGGQSGDYEKSIDVPEPAAPGEVRPPIRIPAAEPTVNAADSALAEVDRLNMVTMHFHTTAKMPLGKPVLIGGMTLEPATGATASKGDPRQLYLILEINVADMP